MIGKYLYLFYKKYIRGLPSCVKSLAVGWWKDFSKTITVDGTEYVEEYVGTRIDAVYYGQYLDSGSGQINLYNPNQAYDYIDPSTGDLVVYNVIDPDGKISVPANGICNIGVYPRSADVNGLLNFDGVDDYVDISGVDVIGTKTISFNLYLKTDTGFSSDIVFNFADGAASTDKLACYLDGTSIYFTANQTAGDTKYYDISNLQNQILSIEIDKTTGAIAEVRIDGEAVSLSSTGSVISEQGDFIGADSDGGNYGNGFFIWNLNINDDHTYLGYPDGNLDVAWIDSMSTSVSVGNSGADGETDWDDSNSDGLADEWTLFGASATASIVTGNGFTGNAQRIFKTTSSGMSLRSDTSAVTNGNDYYVSLKMRSNITGAAILINILNSANGLINSQVVNGYNIGDAVLFTTTPVTVTDSNIKVVVGTSSTQTNVFIEIDEVKFIEDVGINGVVHGLPNTGAASTTGVYTYTNFYPVCERAGDVIHDVLENSKHASVETASWSETLYGSDHLNQCGFLDRETSDSLGYDWESTVNGGQVALDNDCLVPMALWSYQYVYDINGEQVFVDGEALRVKVND